MKTNHLHYIVLLATIFLGCSCSEEIEKELTTGKTAVTIEVDGEEDCLLYTSDAADDLHCVDLGGRSIIEKQK